jgi:hypothetical protein
MNRATFVALVLPCRRYKIAVTSEKRPDVARKHDEGALFLIYGAPKRCLPAHVPG